MDENLIETLVNCLKGLSLAAFYNFLLAEVYKIMNRSRQNNHVMMQSMVFISVILAGAMMVIGNNLAVAFGLVGAVSIIRFRISVNSFLDMSFIFLSIVIGMACGLGFYYIATIIAIFTGIIMLAVYFMNFGKKTFKNYMELEISVSFSKADKNDVMKAVEEFGAGEMTFLEYKSKGDSFEVCFKTTCKDMSTVQNLEISLKEKFPDENFSIKAVRV